MRNNIYWACIGINTALLLYALFTKQWMMMGLALLSVLVLCISVLANAYIEEIKKKMEKK